MSPDNAAIDSRGLARSMSPSDRDELPRIGTVRARMAPASVAPPNVSMPYAQRAAEDAMVTRWASGGPKTNMAMG